MTLLRRLPTLARALRDVALCRVFGHDWFGPCCHACHSTSPVYYRRCLRRGCMHVEVLSDRAIVTPLTGGPDVSVFVPGIRRLSIGYADDLPISSGPPTRFAVHHDGSGGITITPVETDNPPPGYTWTSEFDETPEGSEVVATLSHSTRIGFPHER